MRHRHWVAVPLGDGPLAPITDGARGEVLAAVRAAHLAGRIGMGEFVSLTDRAIAIVSLEEADSLLGAIGWRMDRREHRSPVGRAMRRGARAIGAGAIAVGIVMAGPAALGVPLWPWVGLALWTGGFVSLLAGVVGAAWAHLPGAGAPARPGPPRGGSPPRGPGPDPLHRHRSR